jgi:hypothetical protein
MQTLIKEGAFDADLVNQVNANFALTSFGLGLGAPIAITASGAINPFVPGNYIITKSTAAAVMTLAAPKAGAPFFQNGVNIGGNDGMLISVFSYTAEAHTITATGLLLTGTADVNEATFANIAGAGIVLMAYQGYWITVIQNEITLS